MGLVDLQSIAGKEENAAHQHCFPFPAMFLKFLFFSLWERVKWEKIPVEKEKILVIRTFSFSDNVFYRLFPQGH